MKTSVKNEVELFKNYFEEAFVNENGELIICHPIEVQLYPWKKSRKVYCNLFFNAETCEDEIDFKAKCIEYLSRAAYKTEYPSFTQYIQNYVRENLNGYLGTGFDVDDLEYIYTHLGNGIEHGLTRKFVIGNYDLSIILEGVKEHGRNQNQ